MPEANVLYTVTAVVVAGLAIWVAAALKMAKEPWARPAPATATERAADVPIEKTEEPAAEEKAEEAKADDEKAEADEEKAEEKA